MKKDSLTPDLKKGIFYLITATVLYSIMPVMIRFLSADAVPPISQVFLRYFFAFIAASIYFLYTRSNLTINKKDLFLLGAVAVFGYGLTNLLFTYGVILTQVSTALFIFYSFAILTPILGFLFLKEKANKFNAAALVISFVALLLLFQPNQYETWKLGGLLAFGSAIGQSFYLVGRKMLSQYSSKIMLLVSTFLGMATLGVLALLLEQPFYFGELGIQSLSAQTWLVTILFGFDNFLAWFFMSQGFQYIKSTTGSLILLVENVLALFFAFLFFQEVPAPLTLLGGFLILTAAVTVILKGDNS